LPTRVRVGFALDQKSEEEEPGEQQPNKRGQIEPEWLNVLERIRGEAAELVFDEEFLNERHAVARIAGVIPGQ
jgi:hypothetical protein